ncbi:carbonic anhydrase [Jiangella mangrovi]|uniref:Carbonic anhydrase n=1 Tax=Jiangella mangrovi TaxID=1524084 RepID=A0A7W9GSZ8_9ACTN|nr:carbonic anhydrase [Jiangella mangrovi]MBB5789382.1 carbonic anhydrase [Jiangella mangrovi]
MINGGRLTRRDALGMLGLLALSTTVPASCSRGDVSPAAVTQAPVPTPVPTPLPTGVPTGPDGAWALLAAGNERFATGTPQHPHEDTAYRESLVAGQHPIACVLSCADSRVAPELVFDQGLGDLFTVRSAGEVLDDAVVGSIEYAVEHVAVPLIVVLGHAGCGAVQATVDVVRGGPAPDGSIAALVQAIEPAVRGVPATGADDAAYLADCVAAQARHAASALTTASPIVHEAVAAGRTAVVAGVYDLESGRVSQL